MTDQIRIIGHRRGVGLHDHQDAARLNTVRADIDQVFDRQDRAEDLVDWAGDRSRAPESRLLAEALVLAQCEAASEQRRARPAADLDRLAAITAGLDSEQWRDRDFFDSALAPRHLPNDPKGPVRRPYRLPKSTAI